MPDLGAVVLCSGTATTRRILGLTVGERVLLALSFSGVRRVAFVGDGPRPESSRADLTVVPLSDLNSDRIVLTTSDAVFDRRLIAAETIPSALPLRVVSPTELAAWLASPSLPTGSADSGTGFAIRATDDAAAKQAHKALLLSLRKPIDGWISKHLNRHVSTFITQFLVLTGLSPNVFTVLFLGVGLLGAYLASLGEPWWAILLAGVAFQAQSILDGCDGEIARLTYRFSKVGQWLDSIGDDVTNYAFCFGLAVGQAKVHNAPWILWLGVVTAVVQWTATGVLYRRLIQLGTGDLLAIPDLTTGSGQGPVGTFIRGISKRDVFVFIIATLTAVQLPLVAFLVYSAGSFPTVFGVVLNDIRFGKQLAQK